MEEDIKQEFIKVWEELVKMKKENVVLLNLIKDIQSTTEIYYVKNKRT